jgi:predicted glycoside hydrolase/deacetylase ChbG (UPF0249 family)
MPGGAVNPPRRVALCVDDFGLHAGIDAAVFELAAKDRLSAVSCMVGLPRWRAAGAGLTQLDPARVDVGWHFDLLEAPLQPALRRPLTEWIARAFTGRLPVESLSEEIETQLDAFVAVVGRPPAHVDGHRHVHQLPGVRELLVAALRRRFVPSQRPWLRATRAPQRAGAKPRLIAALGGAGLARLAAREGFTQNRHLLGVYDFHDAADRYAERLAGWLAAAADGDLLMCHPSRPAPAPGDPILPARLAEAEVLCGPQLPQQLAAAGVALMPISRMQLPR